MELVQYALMLILLDKDDPTVCSFTYLLPDSIFIPDCPLESIATLVDWWLNMVNSTGNKAH